MKLLLVIFFVYFFLILSSYVFPAKKKYRRPATKPAATHAANQNPAERLKRKTLQGRVYALQHGLSPRYAFLIDMGLPSGRKRFFVVDLTNGSELLAGLVAHGSCNTAFLEEPIFSNQVNSGCSALGHYKTGGSYEGRFGKAFKLFGLDSSNANCYNRAIVLHGYKSVPDEEVFPRPIGNSLGCPMVSYRFLEKISMLLQKEKKPVLLWIYQ